MGDGVTSRPKMRRGVMAAMAVVVGLALPLLVLEIVLRFLPVDEGLWTQPVNAKQPVFRFAPNRESTWSRGWNFSIINTVRTNNAGFVNDQDYTTKSTKPLLAVVGDSYIEAVMVPYRDTLHGRLAAALAPERRVYSLGASGAPLSQYLVWAREARKVYKAEKLIINVVGNDFDESLAFYQRANFRPRPGFYRYVRDENGELRLRREDYAPGWLRGLVRYSALARYMFFNLRAHDIILRNLPFRGATQAARPQADEGTQPAFVGNTAAQAGARRLRLSRQAVLAFLRDVTDFAGWAPEDVLLTLDGIRYPERAKRAALSYFVQMRAFLMKEATARGFSVIDMQPVFFAHHRATGARYEFPTDGHWNGLAHGLVAQEVLKSDFMARWLGTAQEETQEVAREE